jgi:hypothetical protein
MRYKCTCGKVTAIIKSGSYIRRGVVIVCRECYERLQAADALARIARNEAAKMPEFLKDIFK